MAITCIDPTLGAPRNYHLPTETADNLDAPAFERSFLFTEKLVAALAAERASLKRDVEEPPGWPDGRVPPAPGSASSSRSGSVSKNLTGGTSAFRR